MSADRRRRVVRSADPLAAARAELGPGVRLVSPTRAAARALDPSRPAISLRRLTQRAARPAGVVVGAVARRALLRDACAAVLADVDAAGYATRALAAIEAWLRVDPPEEPPAGLDARALRWWRVARHYRGSLRARGLVDPVETPRLAAQAGAGASALLVHAYPTLEPDEVDALDALAAPGSVVVLVADGAWTEAADAAAERLAARGWQVERRDDAGPDARVRAWRADTVEHEVRAALAEIKGRIARGDLGVDDVRVVVREADRYAAALHAVADEFGLPLDWDRRVPLRATPLGGWLGALVDAVADGLPFEATAALLRHPLCALLDADAFDAARRWRPAGPAAWRRALARAERRDEALAAVAALAPLLPGRPPRDAPRDAAGWREVAPALLERLLRDEARDAHAGVALAWSRGVDDALEAFDPGAAVGDGAPPTRAPPSGAPPRRPWRAVTLRAMREVLASLSAPDVRPPVGAALRVSAPEALMGDRAAFVALLGAAEGSFPAPVTDPPLFDAVDRADLRAVGIELGTPADRARRERLAAWGVWRAAGELWLSYPEQTGRDARLPSTLFADLAVASAALPPRPPASPAERVARDLAAPRGPAAPDDAVLAQARHAWAVELARERDPERDAYDGVVGRSLDPAARRWSASQLTSLGQCRFRWLATSAWGVRAPTEGETEVSPLLRGSLYHHALAVALEGARGRTGAAARAVAHERLEHAFRDAERRTSAEAVPHWRHLRAEHLAHLRALLDHPSFLPDDHEVLVVEATFDGVWHGLPVTGRVDRIDRTPAGVVVIDYKLGGSVPAGARGFDVARLDLELQLPIYLEVAAPALAPGERVAGARYLSLGALREIPREPPDPSETADFVERLRRTLAAGDFPVEASDACRYCDLEAACRKGPRLDRKVGVRGGAAPVGGGR